MPETAQWDAIVLAGGRSSRLGGIDKSALRFDGGSLLDRAVAAVAGASRIVVVGPPELAERLPDRVRLVTEHPRFGGPAAATAAGIEALTGSAATRVAVIATDLPFAGDALAELFAAGRLCADGVLATDSGGRDQPLLAIYSRARLAHAIATAGNLTNASMRALISGLVLCRVLLPDALCADVDTPEAALAHGITVEEGVHA